MVLEVCITVKEVIIETVPLMNVWGFDPYIDVPLASDFGWHFLATAPDIYTFGPTGLPVVRTFVWKFGSFSSHNSILFFVVH